MTSARARHWAAENQAYLTATLARVRGAIERHLGRAPSRPDAADNEQRLAAATRSHPTSRRRRQCRLPRRWSCWSSASACRASSVISWCFAPGWSSNSAFAALCRDVGNNSGPTFSLALAALPGAHWSAITPTGPLRYWKMIEVRPSEVLVTAPLRIDERILHFLAGVAYTDERLQCITRPHAARSALPAAHQAIADQIAALWTAAATSGEPWPVVQIVGEEDAGLADVAALACRPRGLDLRIIRAHEVPGPAAERRVAHAHMGARGDACGKRVADRDGRHRPARQPARRRSARRATPSRAHRRRPRTPAPAGTDAAALRRSKSPTAPSRWRCGGASLAVMGERMGAVNGSEGAGHTALEDCIDRLVNQFNLGPAAIASVGAMATQVQESSPDAIAAELWETCRGQARSRLDDLAQRVETPATWDDLVLPAFQMQILRDIVVQRAPARAGLRPLGLRRQEQPRARHQRAVRRGRAEPARRWPPRCWPTSCASTSTGSISARWSANTSARPRRTSAACSTPPRPRGAVLLFDEADALFGKRSEVKDSHDRYANIEVSYLLQRMEAYRGLAILTTNLKQALDPAFMRRIRFVVQFPFPDAGAAGRDLAAHLPARRRRPRASTSTRLARLNVAGGNIRNIALNAAFLAADERQPVSMAHLLRSRARRIRQARPAVDRKRDRRLGLRWPTAPRSAPARRRRSASTSRS